MPTPNQSKPYGPYTWMASIVLLAVIRRKSSVASSLGVVLLTYFGWRNVLSWLKRNTLHLPYRRQELVNKTHPLRKNTQVIKLSRGQVCYQYMIPEGIDAATESLPLVVLVHGFIGSHAYFQTLANSLVEKSGRRVLRYDNYGRGHSNWDGTPQTVSLFTGQLAELLFALDEKGTIDLVGYSMGGVIASHFAQIYPEKIHSLSLLSPACGAGSGECRYQPRNVVEDVMLRSLLISLLYLPHIFVQTIHSIIQRYATSTSTSMLENSLLWNNKNKQSVINYQKWMKVRAIHEPAMGASIASTLTHFPIADGAVNNYAPLASVRFPIYLGWGARDIGPSTHYGYAKELFIEIGGVSYRVDEEKRMTTLSETVSMGGGRGDDDDHSSDDDDDSDNEEEKNKLFHSRGRVFEWFNGSHGFVIEDGNVVSSRLNHFWYQCRTRDKKEKRIMSWRRATAEDVGEMTQMIEIAYHLGDEFFVDYNLIDPTTKQKYTRTSYDQIMKAVVSSTVVMEGEEEERSGAGAGSSFGTPSSTFMVGEIMDSVTGMSSLGACVQIHSCNVPNQAELSYLTVSKNAQGCGVAKEAMNIAETIAINTGYYSIGIDVVSTKPWLSRFYEKLGYTMTGESSKWPVPQYLKNDFQGMFFHRQTKSMIEGSSCIHADMMIPSPSTRNFYNPLDEE